MRLIKALGAALVVAALIAGPPWALVRFIGNPWPAEGVSLSAPLTDGAIIGLLAAVVWILWAQLATCILVEAIAAVTDDRIQLRAPFTLTVQQHLARRLITAIALAAVATSFGSNAAAAVNVHHATPTPATSITAHGQTSHHRAANVTAHAANPTVARPQATHIEAHRESTAPHSEPGDNRVTDRTISAVTTSVTGSAARTSEHQQHATVTVMRLDSLWSIAERVLDDGERWPEIATLNEGRTMNDGTTFTSTDRIQPGWQLRVPPTASSSEARDQDRHDPRQGLLPGNQEGFQSGDQRESHNDHLEADQPVAAHRVTVEKGDTLSQIALDELGDANAYPAIARASHHITQPDGQHLVDPDVIDIGWSVKVPGRGAHGGSSLHPHQPQPGRGTGDDHTGRGDRGDHARSHHQPETNEPPTGHKPNDHSALTNQPDDHRPPQAIPRVTPQQNPGKTSLPTTASAPTSALASTPTSRVVPQEPSETPTATPRPLPAQPNTTQTAPPTAAQSTQSTSSGQATPGDEGTPADASDARQDRQQGTGRDSDDESAGDITLLRALLASAACLAAGALALLVTNRRRQFRRRRIGRMIASIPPDLADTERVVSEEGSHAASEVSFLDQALRQVAASCKTSSDPLPQLGAAVLGHDGVTLLFTRPTTARLPSGWAASDDHRAWTLARPTGPKPGPAPKVDTVSEEGLDGELEVQPAPYPALVSIGKDQDSRTWLIDLESLGVCGIGGEPGQVADLMRFIVAELAVNAWSQGSEVLLVDDFAAEAALNPARLRPADRSAALTRAAILATEMSDAEKNLGADLLARRRDGVLLDTTSPVIIALASQPNDEAVDTRTTASFKAQLGGRARSRVVVVHADTASPAIELTGDGLAYLPPWGVSIEAFTLPAAEAAAMAALLAATRSAEDEPMPPTKSDDGPLGAYARADGTLREEHTEPRHTQGDDSTSMLPEADKVYLAAAATTAEDLAAIAPSVPEHTRAELEAIDPALDQDIADWFDESSIRPKVHLLGPVDVTARNGGDPAAIDNLIGTISFIAYLATLERGVTGERAAAAFGWKTPRTVQNRATNARFILGVRPDGGEWLPDASATPGARRGAPTYELVRGPGGVLDSADLFVRLRLRAQRRGDDGCEADLVTALSLVSGAPFEAATDRRYPWLFQGQRHDDVLVVAIVDTAHLLATRALSQGRIDLVCLACDAARKASPHCDAAWLDLAAAIDVESGHAAADELVRRRVIDRADEDLPARTEAVLDQRGWASG